MKINIKYTRVDSSPDIAKYLDKRLDAVERLVNQSDESAFAQVEIAKTTEHHKQGDVFRAEINMHTAGHDYYAFAETDDIFSSIDGMRDAIVRELGSGKDKRVSFIRRGGRYVKDIIRGIIPFRKK